MNAHIDDTTVPVMRGLEGECAILEGAIIKKTDDVSIPSKRGKGPVAAWPILETASRRWSWAE